MSVTAYYTNYIPNSPIPTPREAPVAVTIQKISHTNWVLLVCFFILAAIVLLAMYRVDTIEKRSATLEKDRRALQEEREQFAKDRELLAADRQKLDQQMQRAEVVGGQIDRLEKLLLDVEGLAQALAFGARSSTVDAQTAAGLETAKADAERRLRAENANPKPLSEEAQGVKERSGRAFEELGPSPAGKE